MNTVAFGMTTKLQAAEQQQQNIMKYPHFLQKI